MKSKFQSHQQQLFTLDSMSTSPITYWDQFKDQKK